MMQIFKKTNINFIGLRKKFFAISGTFIFIAVLSLAIRGLNLGLDFTGGTLVQVHFEKFISTGDLRDALNKGDVEAAIQSFSDSDSFQIKVKGAQTDVNEVANKITKACKSQCSEGNHNVMEQCYNAAAAPYRVGKAECHIKNDSAH